MSALALGGWERRVPFFFLGAGVPGGRASERLLLSLSGFANDIPCCERAAPLSFAFLAGHGMRSRILLI